MGYSGKFVPHRLDVPLEILVVHKTVLPPHLVVRLGAHLDFLTLGYEDDFAFSRYWIASARQRKQDRHAQNEFLHS